MKNLAHKLEPLYSLKEAYGLALKTSSSCYFEYFVCSCCGASHHLSFEEAYKTREASDEEFTVD